MIQRKLKGAYITVKEASYDTNGRLAWERDGKQHTTYHSYDALDRETQTKFPDTTATNYSHNWEGNCRTVTISDANGHVKKQYFDLLDRLVKLEEHPEASTTVTTWYTYDTAGNLIQTSNDRGIVSTNTYDNLGRLIRVDYPQDGANPMAPETYEYYPAGNLWKKSTGKGTKVMEYEFNGGYRLNKVTEADGRVVNYTYDANDNIVTQSVNGATYTYSNYDARNRAHNFTAQLDGNTFNFSYNYDTYGRQTGITYPNRVNPVTYSYDELDRLLTIPGFVNSCSYDEDSKLTDMLYGNGVNNHFTYCSTDDKLSGITVGPSGSLLNLNYKYDKVGNIVQVNNDYYGYDGMDRLTWTGNVPSPPTGGVITASPNPCIIPTGQTTGTVTITCNTTSTIEIWVSKNGAPEVLFSTSPITAANWIEPNCTYEFTLYQISNFIFTYKIKVGSVTVYGVPQSQMDQKSDTRWSYDSAGNISSRESCLGGVCQEGVAFTYDLANRLWSIGNKTYMNDNAGNRTGKTDTDAWGYIYDGEDRLTQVTRNGTNVVNNTYDGSGMRVKEVKGGQTTYFIYQGNNPLMEYTPSDGKYKYFIYAGNKLVAEETGGVVKYYHSDHLGSTRIITDANGNVLQASHYEPYGNPSKTVTDFEYSDSPTNKGWTVYDGSGAVNTLYDNRKNSQVLNLNTNNVGTSFAVTYSWGLPVWNDANINADSISLDLNASNTDNYILYVNVVDTNGKHWFLTYCYGTGAPYIQGEYCIIPINVPIDGNWHNLCRNLKADLQNVAGVSLDHIAFICIRGNLSLDNLNVYSSIKYGFTGKEGVQETGLIYFGARFYDPETGRFLSLDPGRQGTNWYAYANNNPLRYTDPDGRMATEAVAIGAWELNAIPIWGNLAYAGLVITTAGIEYGPQVMQALQGLYSSASDAASKGAQTGSQGSGSPPDPPKFSRAQQRVLNTLENLIKDHCKETDFSGALRDIQGNPVTTESGKVYDHLGEMRYTLTGLEKVRTSLMGSLNNPSLDSAVRVELQNALNTANSYITRINDVLSQIPE